MEYQYDSDTVGRVKENAIIEIIGSFNSARVFATTLEDGAREQIKVIFPGGMEVIQPLE